MDGGPDDFCGGGGGSDDFGGGGGGADDFGGGGAACWTSSYNSSGCPSSPGPSSSPGFSSCLSFEALVIACDYWNGVGRYHYRNGMETCCYNALF